MARHMNTNRAIALKAGARFFMGMSCDQPGHAADGETRRYTSTRACAACVRADSRRRYEEGRVSPTAAREREARVSGLVALLVERPVAAGAVSL